MSPSDFPARPTRATTKAWLVDLDGTLYPPTPLKLVMGAELLLTGLGDLPTIREFRRQHEGLRESLENSSDAPFEVQLRNTARALNKPPEEVRRVVVRWMVRRPGKWLAVFKRKGLLEELRAFRTKGGRSALVSDYPAREKLQAMGVAHLFDAVVANGEPGGPTRLKPSPEGYLKAAELIGVAPCDCVVVGDREEVDGEAARRAGMHFRQV